MKDTYKWIYNIIGSCHTDFHFDCADALISLYNAKYGETEEVCGLKVFRQEKWNQIHTILI